MIYKINFEELLLSNSPFYVCLDIVGQWGAGLKARYMSLDLYFDPQDSEKVPKSKITP